MRLGFDLDGTVADLHSALTLEARRLFPDIDPAAIPSSAAPGTGPAASETSPDAGSKEPEEQALSFGSLSARQQREIWNAVCDRENFWETLDEIEPGALARLYSLVQEHRWELIFLTSRPETRGDTAQAQSHRWLSKHGYHPAVHLRRARIARQDCGVAGARRDRRRSPGELSRRRDRFSRARDSRVARRRRQRPRQRPSTRHRFGRIR